MGRPEAGDAGEPEACPEARVSSADGKPEPGDGRRPEAGDVREPEASPEARVSSADGKPEAGDAREPDVRPKCSGNSAHTMQGCACHTISPPAS